MVRQTGSVDGRLQLEELAWVKSTTVDILAISGSVSIKYSETASDK